MVRLKFLLPAIGVVLLSACRSPPAVCEANAVTTCEGTGGCRGTQTCSADGLKLAACVCPPPAVCEANAVTTCAGTGGCRGTQTCSADGLKLAACACDPPCDAIAQTGCRAGEKCAFSPAGDGSTLCEANGTVAVHGACKEGSRPSGGDECVAGSACRNGMCLAICNADAPSCAADHLCGGVEGWTRATVRGGVCVPECDPVAQTRTFDGAAACGSPDPAAPVRGCFGTLTTGFTCAAVMDASKTHRVPAADAMGLAYVNSCAPGYLPLLYRSHDDTTIVCVALCRPAETHSGAPELADGVAPHTCAARGATGEVDCRHMFFFEDWETIPSRYSNTLGFCMNYAEYRYDSTPNDGDPTRNTPYPACTSLSSADTDANGIPDHMDWACAPVPTP